MFTARNFSFFPFLTFLDFTVYMGAFEFGNRKFMSEKTNTKHYNILGAKEKSRLEVKISYFLINIFSFHPQKVEISC